MGFRRYQPRHAAPEPATVTALEVRADEHDEVLLDPELITSVEPAEAYARPRSA